jgi:hypothetical protein
MRKLDPSHELCQLCVTTTPANGSAGPLGPRREALGGAARSEPLER